MKWGGCGSEVSDEAGYTRKYEYTETDMLAQVRAFGLYSC